MIFFFIQVLIIYQYLHHLLIGPIATFVRREAINKKKLKENCSKTLTERLTHKGREIKKMF